MCVVLKTHKMMLIIIRRIVLSDGKLPQHIQLDIHIHIHIHVHIHSHVHIQDSCMGVRRDNRQRHNQIKLNRWNEFQ